MKTALMIVVLVIAYGMVSEMDYQDQAKSEIVYRCGKFCND